MGTRLTCNEVGKMFGVDGATVRKWILENKIPGYVKPVDGVRIKRRFHLDSHEVDRWAKTPAGRRVIDQTTGVSMKMRAAIAKRKAQEKEQADGGVTVDAADTTVVNNAVVTEADAIKERVTRELFDTLNESRKPAADTADETPTAPPVDRERDLAVLYEIATAQEQTFAGVAGDGGVGAMAYGAWRHFTLTIEDMLGVSQ